MLDALRVRVQRIHFATFPQQIHQVAPIPTPGVEHLHPRRDISAQNLVEHINIDLPELFLNRHIISSGRREAREQDECSCYSAPGTAAPVTFFFFSRSTTTGGTRDETSPPS